jgi:hypothetical protein
MGSCRAIVPNYFCHHESQTYQNRSVTTAKNPNQTFQDMVDLWAILNILFIVPRNLRLVFPKESLRLSARDVEFRISSPIATVSFVTILLAES